jgi:hypothetical protein
MEDPVFRTPPELTPVASGWPHPVATAFSNERGSSSVPLTINGETDDLVIDTWLTIWSLSTHNPRVFARFCRGLLVLALAPWLVGTAVMPVDHVHERDADHHHAVAHRHLAAHQFAAHDQEEIEGARDESRVVWLRNASLHQRPYHFSIDRAVAALRSETPGDAAEWVAVPSYDASPPHGPPRPSRSGRAPPLPHV